MSSPESIKGVIPLAELETIIKIKSFLGINNNSRDNEIIALIDECKADLSSVGVIYNTDEKDAHIYGAIRLFVGANLAESESVRDQWLARYEAKKGFLRMASGYGFPSDGEESDV